MKSILLTGATDGIGLEAAKILYGKGHTLLVHGRRSEKLDNVVAQLDKAGGERLHAYTADLSDLAQVKQMVDQIAGDHDHIDVILNNAGVFKTATPTVETGMDVRFVVNTIAPYMLAKGLLPMMADDGRIVNIASAAQAPVEIAALEGRKPLSDSAAYAQSKLAVIMWTNYLAHRRADKGPIFCSVNPASFIGTKMVKEAYGMDGQDLSVGATILARAAVDDEFNGANGAYYDNDSRQFAEPHPDVLDAAKVSALMAAIDRLVADFI